MGATLLVGTAKHVESSTRVWPMIQCDRSVSGRQVYSIESRGSGISRRKQAMRGTGDSLDVYLVRRVGSGRNGCDIPGLRRYCALYWSPIGAVEDKQQTLPGV